MENYTIILILMSVMIGASGIAGKIKLSIPVLLLLVGLGLGFLPAMPNVEINPEIVMLLFLPPLLYDAAFNISFKDFRANLHTIGNLSVGLVFITTLCIGVVAHYLIPGMNWPLSFVLGAILSATDAVTAIGITSGLGLPHKTTTILEGESLVNDASALIAYRFAVAAATGVAFVWWKAAYQFVIVLVGGFLIGFLIFRLLVFIIRFFKKNDMVIISLILLMPFVTYLIAEHLKVSGVIAVVILGLGMAKLSREKAPEKLKEQSKHFWDVVVFMLHGFIFLLIGLEFPVLLKKFHSNEIWTYIGYAAIIALVTLGVRMARVYAQQYNLQRNFKRAKGKHRVGEDALFDSKTSFIITWSGMRGIVSLAIAVGLPVTLRDGTLFPMRNEIIFLSIAVVLFSILGQGLSLPWIVKKLEKK